MNTLKVGRITVAIGLVACGAGLLMDNLVSGYGATNLVLRLWPLALVGFGAEYLLQTVLSHTNNEERRLRFDVGGAILLTFVLLLSAGVSGFRTWAPHFGRNFNIGVGPSESRSETKSAPATNARELIAEVSVGTITLQESASPEVRVEATYTMHGFAAGEMQALLEQIKLNITEGEIIRITADVPSNVNNLSIRYIISAPSGLRVRAKTGAGSVDVRSYKGDLDLSSNVGRIEVESVKGSLTANGGSGLVSVRAFEGPISIRTNVGSIQTTDTIGALQLDSGTGPITASNFAAGKLIAETRTGRVDASTREPLGGDVSLKTQTGSVSFSMPQSSSARVTAQTRTGSISAPSFMATTRSGASGHSVGTLGDGKYTVNLEASTGAINLNIR